MSIGMRVPGGWVSNRSVGVKAGPFWAGTRYRRRRRSGNDTAEAIGAFIALPFYLLAFIVIGLWWIVRAPFRFVRWTFRKMRGRA